MKDLQGLTNLRVQEGASIRPRGDVITVTLTNRAVPVLMRLLASRGIGRSSATSIASSEPLSLIAPPATEQISRDSADSPWEEMQLLLWNESNMDGNMLALMATAGAIAAVGLATNALHLVIAAMVIAPGFEPITRVALGIVDGGLDWRRGVIVTVSGYAALIAGAVLAGLVLRGLGIPPMGLQSSYLPSQTLIPYWVTIAPSGIFTSAVAAAAGALIIAVHRPLLTVGALIALQLIPTSTLLGLGLASGEWATAGQGFLRWVIDVALVVALSAAVFGWKRLRVERRSVLS